jgi:cyclohexadienyl dehydratase
MTWLGRSVLALIAVAIAAPLAVEAGNGASTSTLDAIRHRHVLRVGTTGDSRPFSIRNADGSYSGADIVMARQLARRIGVKVEFVPTTWSTLLPDFTAGRFDIAMGGISVSPERTAVGEFSIPTYVDGERPLVRCEDADRYITVAAIDQPNVRLITDARGTNEQFDRAHFPHAQLIVDPDDDDVFDELIAGRADVMVVEGIKVDHEAMLHPQLCAAHVTAPFAQVVKAYLMPKDRPFNKLVDNWLGDEIASGAWKQILDEAVHHQG